MNENGSCFVQISEENAHHVKELMDEVFGVDNCCGLIAFQKTGGFAPMLLSSIFENGDRRRLTSQELFGEYPVLEGRRFQTSILVSAGASKYMLRNFKPKHDYTDFQKDYTDYKLQA
ncbi:MAG: hypothetical protein HY920_07470 [Elusimicrobia bacterium]|nr:hypothetical protein [Elusimicrobiota bacterium]